MRLAGLGMIFLAAGTVLAAGEKGPAPAALQFFAALKEKSGSMEEVLAASALSPFCGEKKRDQIAERLRRLGGKFRREGTTFFVAGERVDGDYAGVLVAAETAGNPLEIDVYALALRRDRGRWKAAPVIGGFENSFVGFDAAIEKRLAALEGWLSAERILRLQQLQTKAEERLRERMNKAVPRELLEKGKPGEVMEAFVKACAARDLAAVLVFLGDADVDDAEAQAGLRGVVSRGLQQSGRRGPWRLLTSPSVVRVVAGEERAGNEADVGMMFYDPVDASPVKLVRFPLHRSAGQWRVDLPDVFRRAADGKLVLRDVPWLDLDDDDEKIRKNFGRYFEKSRKPRREASVEEAGVAIEGLLRDGSLEGLFRFLFRHDDLEATERRIAYAEVAGLWSMFRDEGKGTSEAILLDTLTEGGAGLLVFSVVSSSRLDRVQLTPVLLLKDKGGWGIAPGVTSRGNFKLLPGKLREDEAAVFADYTGRRRDFEKEAASHFLKRFARAAPAGGAKASDAEVRDLVTRFRGMLRDGKVLEASDHCALLDRGDGAWEALTTLSYEYRGARHRGAPDEILGVQLDGPWAALSLRVDSGPGGEPDYPMYLVLVTGTGPRIVLDAGLRLATNKGREVLNGAILKRIEANLGDDEAGLVRRMFRKHVEKSNADRKEWLKSTRSSP
ncbi:MAG: hypothetical protein HKN82_02185 [Akkermansiaceae bacterium]|nr:hypothetical protein [Akkermansiaceae bacterium]